MRAPQAETDSREAANIFNELFQSIFGELSRRKHLICKINEDYSAERIFELKKSFRQPKFEINVYYNHFETSKKETEKKVKKEKKEKKEKKTPTYEISYQMFMPKNERQSFCKSKLYKFQAFKNSKLLKILSF